MKNTVAIFVLFCFCCVLLGYCMPSPEPHSSESSQAGSLKSLKYIMDSLNYGSDDIKIIVSKSAFTMYIVDNRKILLKKFPVVLGINPVDDKRFEGDGCTPEGIFKLRQQYPHSKWNKFIWIDYPNSDSYKKYNEAKNAGKIPAGKGIGGEVGIHGVPAGKDYYIDQKINWTLGCISLKNKDVNELYEAIDGETLLEIRK